MINLIKLTAFVFLTLIITGCEDLRPNCICKTPINIDTDLEFSLFTYMSQVKRIKLKGNEEATGDYCVCDGDKLTYQLKLKDGFLNGECKVYFDDGTINILNYVNGSKEGLWTAKYQSDWKEECTFENNHLNGIYKRFYSDGGLWEKGPFKNGLAHGVFEYYDSNGNVYGTVIYDLGEVVDYTESLSSDFDGYTTFYPCSWDR